MTSPLRQRQRRAIERQISAAALTLFEEKGVQPTTLDEIAREAEVSVRTVLRYFPRKEDTALLAHYELKRALQQAVDEDERIASDPLVAVLDAYVRVLARFDEDGAAVMSALERVDVIKRTDPQLLQAGLRIDAEQTLWLAEVLRERGSLDVLDAALAAETIGVLFRQTLQYWTDRHRDGDTGVSLVGSLRAVGAAYDRVGTLMALGTL